MLIHLDRVDSHVEVDSASMVGHATARDIGRAVALGAVALLLFVAQGGAATADAAPPLDRVSFGISGLFPGYAPQIHDYVVRCKDAPVTVNAHASGAWKLSIADGALRSGDFSKVVSTVAGQSFTVTAHQSGRPESFTYYVRCLPRDFPNFTYDRYGPVTPRLISVENVTSPLIHRYAMIFDSHGVPVWWYHAPTHDTKVLPDGSVVWFAYGAQPGVVWENRSLDGTLLHTWSTVGHPPNDHDIQILPNGNYLAGSYVKQHHVDTSAHGGSSDATVRRAELQEMSPTGRLLWDWKAKDHIGLSETGRWWPYAIAHGYDLNHWNSIEPDGNSVIASFRNLDAVYKINMTTGNIVWKLGGTHTSKSLTVLNDPHTHTLGGQHDAHLQPDGTLVMFDDRTDLPKGGNQPRGVRYAINEQNGTATLVQSITDPAIKESSCCGSARRLNNGDWLISWGGLGNLIGGYKPNGDRTFILRLKSNRTYRAEPVPANSVTLPELRQGMDTMCSGGCG